LTHSIRLLVLAIVASLLSACAYKPLKAPCSASDDGAPLAYTDTSKPNVPDAFMALDSCGPMRPI